jgi:ABC-type molybdate transport system permease subunit
MRRPLEQPQTQMDARIKTVILTSAARRKRTLTDIKMPLYPKPFFFSWLLQHMHAWYEQELVLHLASTSPNIS